MSPRVSGKGNDDYVEAIVVLSSSKGKNRVKKWFEDRSFSCQTMRSGFLISADRKKVEGTFNVRTQDLSEHIELPVPKDLAGDVVSITIPKLAQYDDHTS